MIKKIDENWKFLKSSGSNHLKKEIIIKISDNEEIKIIKYFYSAFAHYMKEKIVNYFKFKNKGMNSLLWLFVKLLLIDVKQNKTKKEKRKDFFFLI